MTMKPAYFDLSVQDIAQARAFFAAVLGWRFERFDAMPWEYWRISAGAADEAGIDGGIGRLADAPLAQGRPLTVLTVPVADLAATLRRVEAQGGRVVETTLCVPGVGWYATAAEPGGLMFGLLQTVAGDAPAAADLSTRSTPSTPSTTRP